MRWRGWRWGCLISAVLMAFLLPVQKVQAGHALELANEQGYNLEERYQPAGAIVTEINTGMILWEEDGEKLWHPASMTKLMTILLAYDAMEEGQFSLDTEVAVTEKYVDIGSRYAMSNNRMQMGVSYTVSELIELIIVPSSAAATYMLADMVEPDAAKFVAKMNTKAKEIGMSETMYYNCVGVRNELLQPYHPEGIPLESDNITTPKDYALLCSYFVKKYPDILNHTSKTELVVKAGTPYEERFKTYQISLEGAKYELEGTDGLKTGSSDTGGFNYSSTAKRGDTRLVEIIMGVSTWDDQTGEEKRHLVGNAVMEHVFQEYEYKCILPKGEHTVAGKEIITREDLWDCVKKDSKLKFTLKDGRVQLVADRKFLPGYQAQEVSYELKSEIKAQKIKTVIFRILKGIGVLFLMLVLAVGARIGYVYYRKQQRKRRRRRRRRKK